MTKIFQPCVRIVCSTRAGRHVVRQPRREEKMGVRRSGVDVLALMGERRQIKGGRTGRRRPRNDRTYGG